MNGFVQRLKIYFEKIKDVFKSDKFKLLKPKEPLGKEVVITYFDSLLKRVKQDEDGGKIYWVEMRDKDKESIEEESHTIRPFIILKDCGPEYYGFYLTSNLGTIPYKYTNYKRYRTVLSESRYDLNKASVVKVDDPVSLPKENVHNYIDTLEESDLIRILKASVLIRGNRIYTSARNTEVGNYIHKDNNRYLVYQKDNSNIYGFKMDYKGYKDEVDIDFSTDTDHVIDHKDVYRVSYDDNIIIPINDNVLIADNADEGVVEEALLNRKQKKYEGKNRNHRRKR